MNKKSIIIGIAGKKQSGKDTLASMINYILSVGIAKADFYKWAENEDNYKNNKIIHFADPLKKMCSQIFNIPLSFFNDTNYKDNYVWSITHQNFIKRDEIREDQQEITIDDLKAVDLDLHRARINCNKKGKTSVISLRTIMQFIGTELIRNKINKDVWIDICINKAIDIAWDSHCIIPDVRFKNESQAIRNFKSCKTFVFKIEIDTKLIDTHESEQMDVEYDYIIENNSNLMMLFYKTLNLLKDII